MLLSTEDREMIQNAVRLAGTKQADIAREVGIAASALSDSLRKYGERPMPEDKLNLLLIELIKRLDERAVNAGVGARLTLQDTADRLRDARDRLVAPSLDGTVPGDVLPGDLSSRFRFDADAHLLRDLFTVGGVTVRLYPPKMGATSIATKMEAQALKDGLRVVWLRPPILGDEDRPLSLMRSFVGQVTGSSDHGEEVSEAEGVFSTAKYTIEKWVLADEDEPLQGHQQRRRTLAIVDRLEDWLSIIVEDGDPKFLQGFFEVLRYFERSPIAKRLSVLVLSMRMPTALGRNLAGIVSDYQRQSNQRSIQLLTEREIGELAERMNLTQQAQHFRRIHVETLGNIFLAHVWLHLLAKGVEPDRISSFIRAALDGRLQPIGVGSQESIAIEVEKFGRSIVADFKLYAALVRAGPNGPEEMKEAIDLLRVLMKDGKVSPDEAQRFLRVRPVLWLTENGVISVDCIPGALATVFKKLVDAAAPQP